jgi:uncharacterized protein YbjT (DUF2867 family)
MAASGDNDSSENAPKESSRMKSGRKKNANKKGTSKKKNSKKKSVDPQQQKKQEIMQQLKAKMEEKRKDNGSDPNSKPTNNKNALGKLINPFQAGKDLRKTLGSLTSLGRGLSEETKQKYYLDDRFLDSSNRGADSASRSTGGTSGILSSFSASSFLQDALDAPSYVPEVLVIGATGEVGRLVVRRLLVEGRFQVRVLVRDLYSQTLNLLGTGVSYCQGDLNNIESLEYALTDVDKIVYVAGAPRPDEDDFQTKFQRYLQENDLKLKDNEGEDEGHTEATLKPHTTSANLEWEQLSSVLEVRSELAEQVDFVGMQNLVSAYQNVRHADYGTSQAAKRSLFKFGSRPEDFNLFALDDGSDNMGGSLDTGTQGSKNNSDDNDDYGYDEELGDDFYDDYGDYTDGYEMMLELRGGKDANVKTQVQWIRNRFGNGVFVGRVPKATSETMAGGESSIISSRLRSRDDPDQGIDLSNGFAGFILRLVSDGNKYEAFVRTGSYEMDGVEYICEFGTDTKRTSLENKSRNRFTTARLAFENFKPVQARDMDESSAKAVPPFTGADIRYLGFRFRSSSNMSKSKKERNKSDSFQSFYLALSYVKVYRVQPEPEFIYLSDARIPPVIRSSMVQDQKRLLLTDQGASELEEDESATLTTTLFDEKTLHEMTKMERSPEETYFKYKGEEILKQSGLSYTIIRVAGFNELPTSEASTIDLVHSNANLVPVSRAEVAQVCVSALMDPAALNKSVYMTKKKARGNAWEEEDISKKFEELPSDPPQA